MYDSQYWTRRGIVQVPGKLFLGAARSVLKLKEPRILVLREWTKVRGAANVPKFFSFILEIINFYDFSEIREDIWFQRRDEECSRHF